MHQYIITNMLRTRLMFIS